MAKPLTKPQPKSSVDRFFNQASLDAALEHHEEENTAPALEELDAMLTDTAPVAPQKTLSASSVPQRPTRMGKVVGEIPVNRPPVEPNPASRGELIDRKREFRLTKSSDETFEELVTLYKYSTQADLTRSHVLRAVLKAISDAMPSLRREAEKIGPLKRPSNAKGFEDRRDEFEGAISDAFKRGMRG